ncbi:HAMP domain-containing histidine kinase [bacterium]|jgi:two-component system phosphate regulon sensor histidine kinase PhoR|nr:HAMP domain-containing histidine kinase [bacterium]
MKRQLLLVVSLAALILFVAVQFYLIHSIWRQKEEILTMRYRSLTREGLSLILSKKKSNGFEKAMDVTDKFAFYLITEELNKAEYMDDTASIRKLALQEIYAIMYKNEMLTTFLKSYIGQTGFDNDFLPVLAIARLELFSDGRSYVLADTVYKTKRENLVIVNTFKEEHNNFMIEYHYLIDLTHKNELVFKGALFSFALIIGSTLIVFLVFGITWRNLMEERRLSELKSDFINNMTHELKTPLSTITVAGRTLEKEQILSDRQRVLETAQLIGKQSIHLNQLINTILEVSFLERAEFELDRHLVQVDELMHQIVTSFLTSCDGCATIREGYGANGTSVSLDIVYFTTMINNLLANAVKYCDREPEIDITTAVDSGDLEITVTDNGVGISRDHIEHIFEKFYRVPHGNIHKTKGLGLGLYYVRRIALAHGGDVSVNSKPGKGTTFKIRIPKS